MKKSILTLLFVSFLINFGNAQTIEVKKRLSGFSYHQEGKLLNFKDLAVLMQPNDEASLLIKKAKSDNFLAGVVGAIGGGLVGSPIGTKIGGGEPNWTLAAIGAGVIVAGIPISSRVNKNTRKAIDIYNNELAYIEKKEIPQFNLIAKNSQIGCSIRF